MKQFTEDSINREYFTSEGIRWVVQTFYVKGGYKFKQEGDPSYLDAFGDDLYEISLCNSSIRVRFKLTARRERARSYTDGELQLLLEDCVEVLC